MIVNTQVYTKHQNPMCAVQPICNTKHIQTVRYKLESHGIVISNNVCMWV